MALEQQPAHLHPVAVSHENGCAVFGQQRSESASERNPAALRVHPRVIKALCPGACIHVTATQHARVKLRFKQQSACRPLLCPCSGCDRSCDELRRLCRDGANAQVVEASGVGGREWSRDALKRHRALLPRPRRELVDSFLVFTLLQICSLMRFAPAVRSTARKPPV
jgi:hypothetical protein